MDVAKSKAQISCTISVQNLNWFYTLNVKEKNHLHMEIDEKSNKTVSLIERQLML